MTDGSSVVFADEGDCLLMMTLSRDCGNAHVAVTERIAVMARTALVRVMVWYGVCRIRSSLLRVWKATC